MTESGAQRLQRGAPAGGEGRRRALWRRRRRQQPPPTPPPPLRSSLPPSARAAGQRPRRWGLPVRGAGFAAPLKLPGGSAARRGGGRCGPPPPRSARCRAGAAPRCGAASTALTAARSGSHRCVPWGRGLPCAPRSGPVLREVAGRAEASSP